MISILGGLCYDPVYIKILMRFGISESGELNRIATLWASGGLLLAVLLLGGFLLLRNLSQEEIFALQPLLPFMVCCFQRFNDLPAAQQGLLQSYFCICLPR